MKKILVILIILILPFLCLAQNYFSYQYDINNDAEAGWWISKTGDKTAIFVGAKCNNNTTNCVEVLRLNENSDLVWGLLLDTMDVVDLNSFVTTEESFYIAGVLSGQSRIGIKIQQFDWNGELTNEIDLSDQFPVSTVNSLTMLDSSLLLTFNKRGDGEHLGITPDTTYYYFMDQDLNYQRHFTNTSGEYRFEVGTRLKKAADNSGYYGLRWASHTTWPKPYYCDVLKFDSLGNVLWTYAAEYSTATRTPDFVATSDGGVVLSWHTVDWETVEPIDPEPSKIIKINTDGEKEWDHTFRSLYYKYVSTIFLAQNGDIIGVGAEDLDDFELIEGGAYGAGWLFRMSPTGEILWERNIVDARFLNTIPYMALYHGLELDNGDLMVTGTIQDTFPEGSIFVNNPNTWLVRTNSMGCIHPDCGRIDVITTSKELILEAQESPFILYPSPASDFIHILNKETNNIYPLKVTIYSSIGRLIKTTTLSSPHERMNIQTFPKGIYRIFLIDKNGHYYHQSFLKQ